jgi:hypothetical protein
MKKNLLLVASLFAGFFASAQEVDENGYATVNTSMEAQYAKQVYYKFSDNTQTAVAANSWDIAFQKSPGGMDLGAIRINDFKVTAIYESGNASTWATTDVANVASWTQLYNSVTEWSTGAFNTASDNTPSFGFAWGLYDMGTHLVNGTRVFVLQYGQGGTATYKKMIIDNLNVQTVGGPTYTLKTSTLTGTTWSADETFTAQVATTETANFVYLSLDTNTLVTVAPVDTAWDFVFNKYYDVVASQGGDVMYNVTGALTNNATVAAVDEAGTSTTFTLPEATAYSANINAIGDKWKTFNGQAYSIPEKTYYVKTSDNKIYRMYFTSFAGGSTGNITFKFKDVTPTAGVGEFNKASFSVFPNPTTDRNVTINHNLDAKGTVNVFTLTGANVFSGELNNSGSQNLNLSSLSAGMYIVKIEAGNYSESKKLVIQ